jgi:hypothetical protein
MEECVIEPFEVVVTMYAPRPVPEGAMSGKKERKKSNVPVEGAVRKKRKRKVPKPMPESEEDDFNIGNLGSDEDGDEDGIV